MVKTLIFKTIKDYYLIKRRLQEMIDEHVCGPLRESGNIVLAEDPKLHLFTSSFREDDPRFKEVLNFFNEISDTGIKVANGKIKASADTYGDIVIYLLLSKEQKKIIDKTLSLGGIKKNPVSITIGTIKENFNVSIEKREEGLKVLMRKVYTFFKCNDLYFNSAQSITI